MKKARAFIGGLFFATSMSLSACAGAPDDALERDDLEEEQVSSLSGWSDPPPVAPAIPGDEALLGQPVMNDCGCGDLVDEDADGVCDHAADGACRRGVTGRCPCGMGCPSGGC
jgi:hypothetical protein